MFLTFNPKEGNKQQSTKYSLVPTQIGKKVVLVPNPQQFKTCCSEWFFSFTPH